MQAHIQIKYALINKAIISGQDTVNKRDLFSDYKQLEE